MSSSFPFLRGFPITPWLLGALAVGCLDPKLAPLTPCTVSALSAQVTQSTDKVDLLFLVDDSSSMADEQNQLTAQFPALIRALVTGNADDDPEREFPPATDLHIAVVSSDLGNGGAPINACSREGRGAVFNDRPRDPRLAACKSTYPGGFLAYHPASTGGSSREEDEVVHDFECLARLGTGGCGLEQQLDAALRSLTPASSDFTFRDGTRGRGDESNVRAFLRPDSILAVVFVTDEDDCSSRDLASFFQNHRGIDANLRCQLGANDLRPVADYVAGFKALRASAPDRLVLAAITGVPEDAVANPSAIDYDALLADPRMAVRENPTDLGHVVPACYSRHLDAMGHPSHADPARRIVSLIRELGPNGIVQSICQDSFAPALRAISNKLGSLLGKTCLGRRLDRDAVGDVPCDVIVKLPAEGDVTRCDTWSASGFSAPQRRIEGGREVCVLPQVQDPDGTGPQPATGQGWFYDDVSPDLAESCSAEGFRQRISFTTAATPPAGAQVRLECLKPTWFVRTRELEPPAECTTDASCGSPSLFCAPATRTCQLHCTTDADCPGGFICDGAADPPRCMNPICAG